MADKVNEQVKQDVEALRVALAAMKGRDTDGEPYECASADYVEKYPDGTLVGDEGGPLSLQVIHEDLIRGYSVVLANQSHTFYLAGEGFGSQVKVYFATLEEIVAEFPGLAWR